VLGAIYSYDFEIEKSHFLVAANGSARLRINHKLGFWKKQVCFGLLLG